MINEVEEEDDDDNNDCDDSVMLSKILMPNSWGSLRSGDALMFRGIWLPPNTEEAARGIYIELVEKVLPQCNTECCKFQIPPSAATRNQYIMNQ